MKRSAPILAPLALAAPLFAISAQDAGVDVAIAPPEQDSGENFPWPNFIETDPLPGRYRTIFTIEDMSFPSFDGGKVEGRMAETMENQPEPEIEHVCLAGPPDRADWIREFGDNDCTTLRSEIAGDAFDVTMQCRDGGGMGLTNARFSGTANETGMDLLLAMRITEESFGKMRMNVRIQVERVGDCE